MYKESGDESGGYRKESISANQEMPCSQNNKNRITRQKEGDTSRKVRNNIEAETWKNPAIENLGKEGTPSAKAVKKKESWDVTGQA